MTNEEIAQLLGGLGLVLLVLGGLAMIVSRQRIKRKQTQQRPKAEVGVIKGTKPAQPPPSNIIYPDSTRSHY